MKFFHYICYKQSYPHYRKVYKNRKRKYDFVSVAPMEMTAHSTQDSILNAECIIV